MLLACTASDSLGNPRMLHHEMPFVAMSAVCIASDTVQLRFHCDTMNIFSDAMSAMSATGMYGTSMQLYCMSSNMVGEGA